MPASFPQPILLMFSALLPMSRVRREATLKEILSDPIVRAVMEADAVDPDDLDAMLRRIAKTLERLAPEDHDVC